MPCRHTAVTCHSNTLLSNVMQTHCCQMSLKHATIKCHTDTLLSHVTQTHCYQMPCRHTAVTCHTNTLLSNAMQTYCRHMPYRHFSVETHCCHMPAILMHCGDMYSNTLLAYPIKYVATTCMLSHVKQTHHCHYAIQTRHCQMLHWQTANRMLSHKDKLLGMWAMHPQALTGKYHSWHCYIL